MKEDVDELVKCANDFSLRAEQTRDFGFVTRSNALRKSTHQIVDLLITWKSWTVKSQC